MPSTASVPFFSAFSASSLACSVAFESSSVASLALPFAAARFSAAIPARSAALSSSPRSVVPEVITASYSAIAASASCCAAFSSDIASAASTAAFESSALVSAETFSLSETLVITSAACSMAAFKSDCISEVASMLLLKLLADCSHSSNIRSCSSSASADLKPISTSSSVE